MRRIPKFFELNALSISVFYIIASLVWILLSDQLLEIMIDDLHILPFFQTIKGLVFVIGTAVLLYLLIQFSNRKALTDKQKIDDALKAANMATWCISLETGERSPHSSDHELFRFEGKPEEWSADTFFESVHPEDVEKVQKLVDASIANDIPYNAEYRIIWPDGATRWMQSRGTLQKDPNGQPTHMAGVVADVTSQKMMEEKYRKEKEIFERIFETIPVMINIYDPEVKNVRVNQAFENIMGWSNKELSNLDLMMAAVPDKEYRKKVLNFMQQADGSWGELEILTKSKEKRMQRWTNLQLSNDTTVGIGLDITKQKILEQKLEEERHELQRSKARYQKAEQIAKIGHWQRNLKTDEAIWSDGIYNLMELEKKYQNVSFADFLAMLHPDDQKPFKKAFEKAAETGYFSFIYRLFKQKSGETGYFHELGEVEYDEDGNPALIRGTIQEITELKKAEIELQNEKQRFELVANTSSDVIWDLDPVNNKLWWSDGFENTFGHILDDQPDNILSWTNYLHPEDIERVTDSLEKALASKAKYWKDEYRFLRADGSVAFIEDNGIIIRDSDGKAIQMIGTLNDVTEKKRAKEKLQESEQKYRHLFKQNPQPMWIFNPADLKFIEVNDAAIHHYGYSEEEFLSMTIVDIRPKKDADKLKKLVGNRTKTNKASYSTEWKHIKKDGTIISVSISSSDIKYENKIYRIVLATDITKQKKAEERVIASVVEGENRERKRLAQELHDGLGQYLAAANMNLDNIQDAIAQLPEKKYKQFQKGIHFLKHAITETRSISHNLMPRAVDDYGLPLALEALVDNFKKSTEITFYYYQNLNDTDLSDEISINIYRIAQEALSNAVKYAHATNINVQLIKDGVDLMLTIDDNGKGFDRKSSDFKPGMGLQTIRTRTDAIGGVLEIETKPGAGTLLNVVIPLSSNV